MQRREFITLLGGTIAWPSIVHGQEAEPRGLIVGFLGSGSRDQRPYLAPAIGKGLNKVISPFAHMSEPRL